MIEIAIMIEGQNGLNWERWQKIAVAVEDLGFVGLYRSDHFTNAGPPDKDSLELWTSLTWLASHTKRVEFGPLVSPLSFRHPTFTARMASAVDDLSGGRLRLGLGAGWQEREHNNYGFELLDIPSRFDRFEEGLQVISLLLNSDTPIDFHGKYYNLNEAILLPRPNRPAGPPIIIGGNGKKRTLPLVARYASEWNSLFITCSQFIELNKYLDELIRINDRDPADVKRSMMTGCVFAKTTEEVNKIIAERTKGKRTAEQLRNHGSIVGTPTEITDQIMDLAASGLDRIILQWLDLDNLEGLEALAKSVLN